SCVAVFQLHLLGPEALAVEQTEQKISEPIPHDFSAADLGHEKESKLLGACFFRARREVVFGNEQKIGKTKPYPLTFWGFATG
ncbi:hypothetical protein N9187_04655, partial [Akkermansiaceae bacterium]|nr:hypothetical protein [Akkermansiaceae bacterium]